MNLRPGTRAALAALVLVAGCAGPRASPVTAPSTLATTASPGPPTGGSAIRLSERSKARTVHAAVGERLVLVLHNTYWRIDRPGGTVLRQVGLQQDRPGGAGACRPGVGCGTVLVRLVAVAPGAERLTASRTTCGEAMACPPGEGEYAVRVVVG